MSIVSINADLCRMDGICASVCPTQVIKGPVGKLPVMRNGGEDRCISCGQCIAFCPHGAVTVDSLPEDEVIPVDRKQLPDAASFAMLAKSRRSVRQFKEMPVSQEAIVQVLETARFAPSAKNMQPVRWIAVTEKEKFQAIGDCMAQWFEEALKEPTPVLAEAKTLLRSWRAGGDPLFRGAPALLLAVTPNSWQWGAVDAAVALSYMELAAHAQGLGTCWAGYVTLAALKYAPLKELLGASTDESIVGGQMIGYPRLRSRVIPPRKHLQISWL